LLQTKARRWRAKTKKPFHKKRQKWTQNLGHVPHAFAPFFAFAPKNRMRLAAKAGLPTLHIAFTVMAVAVDSHHHFHC
jgi:hypothetical protein